MRHICTCMHTALHLTFWNRGWIIRKSLPEQWSREGNKENIWNKKSCGCVDWSWGSRQWRRELYGLIVLCRQGIEDDEEAFPWECCCVLLEQTHSLISCLGRNKHWQLIWRGVSLHLFELCRKATEPWLNLRDKSGGHPLGPCCLCWKQNHLYVMCLDKAFVHLIYIKSC